MNQGITNHLRDRKGVPSSGKAIMARTSSVIWSLVRAVLLIGLAYVILYPVLYSLSVSIREPSDMMDPTVIWLPKNLTLDNIRFVLKSTDFVGAFVRSLMLSLVCSVLQMFSCSVTGYGFARFRFRGRNLLFFAALLTVVVPPQIISMPLYIQYAQITAATGIPTLNTIRPTTISSLFAQGLKAGLFIYLFRQSYKGMPLELEDAAYLDGCGPIKAYLRVMLPNSGPIMLVTFILSFVWYWNDYINVSLFFNNAKPLAVLLEGLGSILLTMRTPEGLAFGEIEKSVYTTTFCLLFILLPIILYAFLQKRFTKSLMNTSIVG